VLSIGNRITGVLLGIGGVGLVVWLSAGALGPAAYAGVTAALLSIPGQVVLFLFTLAFFFHLCAGVRHLMWDTVHGFELRTVYISGWIVVMASLALTDIAWAVGLYVMS
jgi:succinate dehydrogenase / fumarate reductase cytochrome b subunit